MLLKLLTHLFGIEDIDIELLDVLTNLSYFLFEFKRKLLLELELEDNDGVRFLVLYQECKKYLLLLAMAIYRVDCVVERCLNDFLDDCEVLVVDENGASGKDCEVVPIDGEDSLDSTKFMFDVDFMKCVIFFIGRVLQQVTILIAKNNHIEMSFFIRIDVFYALKAFHREHPDHFQRVPMQDRQVRLVESNINMGLVGCDGTDFDILVVEVVLKRYFSEAFFAFDLLVSETVLVEEIVGAVVEGGCGEVQALRLEPIW